MRCGCVGDDVIVYGAAVDAGGHCLEVCVDWALLAYAFSAS